MKIKYFIPNIITSGNLLCGTFAIVYASRGDLILASMFIGIAAILDFLDGFTARMLQATSEFGKQMDSLADVITFGVAPAIVFYNLAELRGEHWYNFLAMLIALFAALRLAKFNIDDSQKDEFRGVPTPAIAILVAALPFILENDNLNLEPLIESKAFIILFPILTASLMVSRIRLFSLKIKNFKFSENKLVFIFLMLSIALIALFQFTGIALIICAYIVFSLIRNIAVK